MRIHSCDVDIPMDPPASACIVIENKAILYQFLSYCNLDYCGDNDWISYFVDEKPQDNDKAIHFIPNVFNLDLNSKKNINGLYKLLKKKYYEELKIEIQDLQRRAETIVKGIAMDFDVDLSVGDTISEDDLFKAMNLSFSESDSSLIDRFIRYVMVIHELQNISVFLVYRLRDFFESKEIESIYHELNYKSIILVDIEGSSPSFLNEKEYQLIIDKDLCSI